MTGKKEIVFVGSGNTATTLALILKEHFIIRQIYSRNLANASTLAEKTGSSFTSDITGIYPDSDYYFICLSDDAVTEISNLLKLPGKLVVHTSGTLDISILKTISEKTGVIYPLQTLKKESPARQDEFPVCYEAVNPETANEVREISSRISSDLYEMDSLNRRLLHLAAAFSANLTNHLYAISYELCVNQGVPFEILIPLIRKVTQQATGGKDPAEFQTGPAVRGDFKTIQSHLSLLESTPDLKNIYQTITQHILKRYGKL